MRLLKLTTSDEVAGGLPPESRAGAISAHFLEQRLGEPCELKSRVIWPGERLPALVERWVDEFQPDLVLFVVNAFWVSYKSTPLRLQRRLGAVGRLLGRAGIAAAGIPWLAYTPPFKLARRLALRAIGGDYYFEPEEILELTERIARQIVSRESAVLVVRGPLDALTYHGRASDRAEADARRLRTHEGLRALCDRLRVAYTGADVELSKVEGLDRFERDMVHTGRSAHEARGLKEGEALLAAWQSAH
jgi:hypothetical protein